MNLIEDVRTCLGFLDQLPSTGCEILWRLLCYSQIHSLKLLEMPRLPGLITPGTVSWPPFGLSSGDCCKYSYCWILSDWYHSCNWTSTSLCFKTWSMFMDNPKQNIKFVCSDFQASRKIFFHWIFFFIRQCFFVPCLLLAVDKARRALCWSEVGRDIASWYCCFLYKLDYQSFFQFVGNPWLLVCILIGLCIWLEALSTAWNWQ